MKVSRGKFLGGSSGVNGTLCIRGTKQDYDDWDMPGWSGEEVFSYMKKVGRRRSFMKQAVLTTSTQAENFHDKKWFKADSENHGRSGLLHIEPHDLVSRKGVSSRVEKPLTVSRLPSRI